MGFLSNLLPMVVGGAADVFLGPEGGMAADAAMGALKYKQSGSLMQGIMAGMSAYGGGQLAQGAMSLGNTEQALQSGLQNAGITNPDGSPVTAQQWNNMSPDTRAALTTTNWNDADMPTNIGTSPIGEKIGEGVSNYSAAPTASNWDTFKSGISAAGNSPSSYVNAVGGAGSLAKYGAMAAAPALMNANTSQPATQSQAMQAPYYQFSRNQVQNPAVSQMGAPVTSFNNQYTPYSTPQQWQPISAAKGGSIGMARGGISDLGGYSDGGRLLKGPGDGVSDSIPATIANKQPARLADGEFVVPARIVSELGNGSTEAGARQLYAMMDRVQQARKKTVGKDAVAKKNNPSKVLPA